MKTLGDNIIADDGKWSFSGDVHETFDAHVSKSVPSYLKGHDLILNLSDYFVQNDSFIYDIGCSTGTLIRKLQEKHKRSGIFVGIDVVENMISTAKSSTLSIPNIEFHCESALEFEYEKSDLITAYYTLQFVRPRDRQKLFTKIYDTLNWGGAFIFFEKVRAPDARFQDIMTTLYHEYKLEMGYSETEVMDKAHSLKGILEPYSTRENFKMCERAGFVDIMTISKDLSFEGFLAIK